MNEFLIQKYSLFVDKQCKNLFDSIVEIVDGSISNDLNESNSKSNKETVQELEILSNLSISDKLCCTVCNIPLLDRDEQVTHYKSDLHRLNLKRKLNGKICVTAEEFEKLSDVSSISGSDSANESSDDDDDSISESDDLRNENQQIYAQIVRNQPKIAFKLNDSNVLVMHRALLHGKKNNPEKIEDLISVAKSITNLDQWCIILVNAGHFAGAIFKGEEVLLHKTFHRYVIRAKRGTVQSVHDNSGGHARSAGAQMRRHHEAAFKDEIKALLDQWKKELDKCKCIFLRAPKYNQQIFYAGKNAIFSKLDMRIRNIPFMTFRPTFNEIKRVHFVLRTLELYNSSYTLEENRNKKKGNNYFDENNDHETKSMDKVLSETSSDEDVDSSDEELSNVASSFTNKKKNKRKLKTMEKEEVKKPKESTPPKEIVHEIKLDANSQKVFNELYSACITNDTTKLASVFDKCKTNDGTSEFNLDKIVNYRFDKNGLTLLHLASSLGHAECLKTLLLNGSNPCLLTYNDKKVPYLMSKTKPVRDLFRRFMHDYPNLHDYSLSKIPTGLSLEKEVEKQNKEKERRRLQRKLKKERDEESKNVQKKIQFENEEKQKFLSLNDEEKRLLMLERRFASNKDKAKSSTQANQAQPTIKQLDSIKPEKLPVNISRCWYCAENMSTNVPYEYYDYKFCSIKCLKSHRQLNKK